MFHETSGRNGNYKTLKNCMFVIESDEEKKDEKIDEKIDEKKDKELK